MYDKNKLGGIIPDLKKFSKHLSEYKILVYDDEILYRKPVYRSNKSNKEIILFFFRKKKHFIPISNIKGFFGVRIKCRFCDKLI